MSTSVHSPGLARRLMAKVMRPSVVHRLDTRLMRPTFLVVMVLFVFSPN